MPLHDLKPYLEDADSKGYAIGCFNIINLESLDGVLKAAENLNSPVCITFHPPHFKYTDIQTAASAVKTAASKMQVPVILHLDNARDASQVADAIRYGFNSIMYIGNPEMDFTEKAEKTKNISEIVHAAGIILESDICLRQKVAKSPDIDSWKTAYVESMMEFCEQTGIDIISVDIVREIFINGRKDSTIDMALLQRIKRETKKYLSLHGGSGLSDDILKQAFKTGLNKMHIYGRSADTALSKIKELVNRNDADLIEVMQGQRESFREVAQKSISVFGSAGKASNFEIVQKITEAVLNKLKENS
ncbi:MAG: class II fructose-bisphosphate aldolase [Candidatus Humimicrobiaceae bacterium]